MRLNDDPAAVAGLFGFVLTADPALSAGILGATLALAGSRTKDWRKIYIILLGSACLARWGAPVFVGVVRNYFELPEETMALVGFVLGISGIKFIDWLLDASLSDIGKALGSLVRRRK